MPVVGISCFYLTYRPKLFLFIPIWNYLFFLSFDAISFSSYFLPLNSM